MAKITSLASSVSQFLSSRQPQVDIYIKPGNRFSWDHSNHTVTYDPSDDHSDSLLLHEVGHGILNHNDYTRDITLLEMERAAWDQAKLLSRELGVNIDDDIVETSLDTYRDWLHARSLCPTCGSTGIQSGTATYKCLACGQDWRVNEARSCGLRRYIDKKHP